MKQFDYKRLSSWIYGLILIVLTVLFFSNDFGLLDIRKSSIIVGVGIDLVEEEVKVTAQLAVPQPAENGDNTQFSNISGQGATVADALKKINGKTGFYPKLLFCNVIILGDSCKEKNIFDIIDYFYRNEYTGLMPSIAMCEGEAGKLLESKTFVGESAVTILDRLLSEEAKKSAVVSSVNLKKIGEAQYSASAACYMPCIQAELHEGGESGEEGSGNSGESGGKSNGSGEGGGQTDTEFLCNTTAIFSQGKFVGIMPEEQSFALNLLENEIRHAFISCDAEGKTYTVGLRNCGGGINLKFDDGIPKLKVSFSAIAQIQDVEVTVSPDQSVERELLSEEVLNSCRSRLAYCFGELIEFLRQSDCDVIGVKNKLKRFNYKYYDKFNGDIMDRMKVEYDLDIKGVK